MRIPGRNGTTTVYNEGQSISMGGEVRQEDPSRWHPKNLSKDEILKRFKWSDAQLDAATTCGFPASIAMYRATYGTAAASRVFHWRSEEVDAWHARITSLKVK